MSETHTAKPTLADRVRQVLIVLFFGIFAFSTAMFVRDVYQAGKENTANQALQEQVRQAEAALPAEKLEKTGNSTGMLPQYEGLWQQNNDMAGWLSINGTPVDYPVTYTPDDPEYYLRRAFDGSYAISGSLFLDENCPPGSNHLLIYGHQMKNGTMFGSLSQYAKENYAKEHPVIGFDTLYTEEEYEVMASFYSRAYNEQDEDVFRYYQYTDLSEEETFDEYVRKVKEAALYDTGIDAQYGDSIITLSTCSSHVRDGRFVVVARKKQG